MTRTISIYNITQNQVNWVINHLDQSKLRQIGKRIDIMKLENWELKEVIKWIRREGIKVTQITSSGLYTF